MPTSEKRATWLPSEVQAWLRFVLIVAALRWFGFDAGTISQLTKDLNGTAESVSLTASNLETIVTSVLERQEIERRKRWTLSNDLARIERKIDELKGHP